jgi:hypothetical protein
MTEWYGPHRLALVPVQETELDPMAAYLTSSEIAATRSPRHDRRYECHGRFRRRHVEWAPPL